jgi:hypothetical protein
MSGLVNEWMSELGGISLAVVVIENVSALVG